jgi:hypothetical protein
MKIKADYEMDVEDMNSADDTVSVVCEVNVGELAATIIQDATYRECRIMGRMLERRKRILVIAQNAAEALVALTDGESAFSVAGCKTGRVHCGSAGDEGSPPPATAGGHDPLPTEPESGSETDLTDEYLTGLLKASNIDLAT